MHVVGAKKRGPRGAGDERCTPEAIWRPMLEALGIDQWDLDPCTNAFSTVPARVKWSRASGVDGLGSAWFGHVWVNFPFSSPKTWTKKIVEERARPGVKTITVLSPGDTGNGWWPSFWNAADAWAAWPQREHFPLPDHPKGSPGGAPHLWLLMGASWTTDVQRCWMDVNWVQRLRARGIPCERRTGT